MKSETSQPDFAFFPSDVSMITGEHRASRGLGVTSDGVLKQHKMYGEWRKGLEVLYKGAITIMDHRI